MSEAFDIIIIGGGVAGLSAAAALSSQAHVLVLEAEQAVGYHSSGRSATMLHYALGDPLVRELTRASRSFFEQPPPDFSDSPLGRTMPVLVFARADEEQQLDQLEAEMGRFASLERVDATGIAELCPPIRTGPGHAHAGLVDRDGIRLDPHALLQGFQRQLRRLRGKVLTGERVSDISRGGPGWRVRTEQGKSFSAPVLVNAAGAWADDVGQLAEVPPIGLQPLRRTIITFDPPAGTDVSAWPFARTIGDELYFAPESGRLFASPMDEAPSDPCDAQPDEYEVALAAWRVEQRTTLSVGRIHSRWAGLRSFARDRHPVVGFAPDAPGFFWLAGQGGFGLQTCPILAAVARSLIVGSPWPDLGLGPQSLSPGRFLR